MKTAAILLAAGTGSRMGGHVPKQYRMLDNRSVLVRALEALQAHSSIDYILPVINSNDVAMFEEQTKGMDFLPFVLGGSTRQESVRNGLTALVNLNISHVIIHDAARCMVSQNLISEILNHLKQFDGGVVPCTPVTDTIKQSNNDMHISATLPRSDLWRAQTPQGFPFDAIYAAHNKFKDLTCTDDAEIAEKAGLAVQIIEGELSNIKITTEEDLSYMAHIIADKEPSTLRIGSGFDVHRFTEGDHIMLCGVRIPHSKALKGHSDADVALHALTDAILGALALGDIGDYFPPNDPQWQGKESSHFFGHAINLMRSRGGRLSNIDVTIICEEPKITPHKATMRQKLADLTDLPLNLISVKATTTEGLGFTGRSEGIAVQAALTIWV